MSNKIWWMRGMPEYTWASSRGLLSSMSILMSRGEAAIRATNKDKSRQFLMYIAYVGKPFQSQHRVVVCTCSKCMIETSYLWMTWMTSGWCKGRSETPPECLWYTVQPLASCQMACGRSPSARWEGCTSPLWVGAGGRGWVGLTWLRQLTVLPVIQKLHFTYTY